MPSIWKQNPERGSREGVLGRFTITWQPPDSDELAPVSIEMESRRFYWRLTRETRMIDGRMVEVVVPERDPEMRGMNLWFRWPEPFNYCFPSGEDMISGCTRR
jgi:hypothetical protein